MTQLYLSCSERALESVWQRLAEAGRKAALRSPGGGMAVVPDPDAETLRLTIYLLKGSLIDSAALLSKSLADEDLWIAREWLQRFVVERTLLPLVEPMLAELEVRGEYRERNLVIFGPSESKTKGSEVFGEHVERASRVLEDPGRYYGELADPLVGGANALYAAGIEAARDRGFPEDSVVVAPPEALGFRIDHEGLSVQSWRKKSVIEAEAVGFGLGSASVLAELFERHSVELDLGEVERLEADWRGQGLAFGIGLILRGLQDPPVVIPVGSVYQQPAIGSTMQNLAVAQAASANVAAGATVPLILPAWCLNPTFSTPSGPLSPTPLVAASASGTQQAMWDMIRARYRGGS
jgi:hypothetical protein